MDYDNLQLKLYKAFINAANETGDNWRNISWFTRNKIKEQQEQEDV